MKKHLRTLVCITICLSLCFPLCACSDGEPTVSNVPADDQPLISFTDDLGRSISIARPTRVAAMIGSFAEIWCLAGGRGTLVAAASDTWTSFDLGLDSSVVDIGAVKSPSLETLLAARPDFILASCNTTANLELEETFSTAGITTAYFDVQTIDDYLNMLNICTQLTGHEENYDVYGTAVKAQSAAAIARQDGSSPRILCIRATGSSCKAKGSRDNLLGGMLHDLGCVNIADSDNALLDDLSLENILADDPEYIFVVLQGADPTRAMETLNGTLLSNPAWQQLTAVKEDRFYTLEHELYNLKPNDRWGEAYEKLADILYGEQ